MTHDANKTSSEVRARTDPQRLLKALSEGGVRRRDAQSGAGLWQRRSRIWPVPGKGHAARARRARGLLRGGARRAALRATCSAQHHHPPCASVHRWGRSARMDAPRRCSDTSHRLPRLRLFLYTHVPLYRGIHRFR